MGGKKSTPGRGSTPSRRGRPARREQAQRLARRDREIEAARRVSDALFQHLTPDDVVRRALQTALDVVGAESGSILLADPSTRQLVFRHSVGASVVAPGTAIPWEKGIAGEVFRSGKPIIIQDAHADPRHYRRIDELLGHVTRDLIALPLKRWEGDPIGVLEILNKRQGCLDEDDLAILTIVSAITALSLEQARLYQEAKLAEVARIVGDLGHDIKNLLMPVVAGIGLLESEVKDRSQRLTDGGIEPASAGPQLCADVVHVVRNSVRRIQDYVSAISDCVKGLSSPPAFASCHPATIVAAVYDTVRRMAQERGVVLMVEGLDEAPAFEADERRLFSALYNLVNNAIPEVLPGGSVTVRGRLVEADDEIELEVEDTGRGMPAEVRESLFTARVVSRKPGGTGLGTKIVKDVVDVHGGRITVESEVGKGTSFRLRLPRRQRR